MSRLNEVRSERIEIAKYFVCMFGSVMVAVFTLA
jgi:hypothetical protein